MDTQESAQWGRGATAHSDLLLVLHVGQLHILFLDGGWGLLQVATNHELVHEDTSDGTQEWGDNGYPPPVPASPGGRTPEIRDGSAGSRQEEGRQAGEWGLYSREDF